MQYLCIRNKTWLYPSVSRTLALAAAIGSLAGLTTPSLAQGDARYRVVPLPLPDGATGLSGLGLNNSNEVTGTVSINSQQRPFHFADGRSVVLDEIEGIYSSGLAINDRGHVAGWMYEWGVIWPQAFLWDGTTNHWLVDPHNSNSYAQGLNEREQVVGFYYPPGGHANGNAFVVTDGAYYNLGSGQATDISENGIIVGQINRYFGATAVWTPDGRTGWSLTVLDGLLATAINDSGTIFVGGGPLESYFDNAVLWTNQNGQWVRTQIGNWDPSIENALPSDVNDRGQVVGNHQSFTENDQGWIYENGKVSWLTDRLTPAFSGWEVMRATKINESGVVLANARPKGERGSQTVLLIPEQLTILGLRGDGAGSTNELIAVSATPGSRIYFAVGFAQGSRALPGCPGVRIGLSAPRVVGSSLATANREARVSIFVPGGAAGRTIYLQAIDPAHCEVSNVLRYTLR